MSTFTSEGEKELVILLAFWLVMVVINLLKDKRK
jgi:hypothetical protein